MSLPVALGSGLGRFARASDDYAKDIIEARTRVGGRKLSGKEKQAKLMHILAGPDGIRRLGQAMIGPIQLKLRYQGILRNVLLEDALVPGTPIEYDIQDDLGQAYIMHGNAGEVRITPFEGKRVTVPLFRIATFPQIKKEDLYMLRSNSVEYAQDESKQAIMVQEDNRLVSLIEAAITRYRLVDASSRPAGYSGPGDLGGSLPNEVTVAGDTLMPDDLYTAVSFPEQRQLESARLLMNPQEWRDFFRWEIAQTGWAFKDAVVAGEKIVQFGEFQIGKSIIIPRGTVYLTPEPQYLGVFPVMYSLDVVEDNKAEAFKIGWVMDELVGMAILNPRGLVALRKT